jgi:hypothetical protein
MKRDEYDNEENHACRINRKRKPDKLISIIKGNPPIYSSFPLHFFTF